MGVSSFFRHHWRYACPQRCCWLRGDIVVVFGIAVAVVLAVSAVVGAVVVIAVVVVSVVVVSVVVAAVREFAIVVASGLQASLGLALLSRSGFEAAQAARLLPVALFHSLPSVALAAVIAVPVSKVAV